MQAMDRSSSNDLSSAPSSDIEGPVPARPTSAHSNTIVVARDSHGSSAPPHAAATKPDKGPAPAQATRQESAPVKQRKPRKKKEVDPNAPPAPEKEKKPRKPRASAGTGRANKKLKTEDDHAATTLPQHSVQTTDLSTSRLVQPAPFVADIKPPPLHEAAKITQNGFSNHNSATNSQPQSPIIPRYHSTPQPHPQPQLQPQPQPQPPAPAPRARNIFDPVRGIERSSEQPQPAPYPALNETPPRPTTFRASASPAIASIINHPETNEFPPLSFQPAPKSRVNSIINDAPITNGNDANAMNLDGMPADSCVKKTTPPEKPMSDAETKPKRAKEQPPPVPVGSGLLSSSFFGGDSASEKPEKIGQGVSIVLQIDLKKEENKIFNFARMAEEKYGFAAVYPRQAAQKERLAKVAAAGAALERLASGSKRGETSVGESGDEDLSVDIDRDSDNDGDINMTGMNGTNENSGTDGPAPKQRRKRRDEYDADDPFVDDSEALWEAQAAASKDGFFVYMGALQTENEKPATEKTEGTSKRGGRGRGRGGGVGSRGGRGGNTSAAGGEGSTRGTRGGGVTRKPRITKAERQQRELEKKQREQAGNALATKPATAAATAPS